VKFGVFTALTPKTPSLEQLNLDSTSGLLDFKSLTRSAGTARYTGSGHTLGLHDVHNRIPVGIPNCTPSSAEPSHCSQGYKTEKSRRSPSRGEVREVSVTHEGREANWEPTRRPSELVFRSETFGGAFVAKAAKRQPATTTPSSSSSSASASSSTNTSSHISSAPTSPLLHLHPLQLPQQQRHFIDNRTII
jgi:hypothetical protein